MRHAFASWLGVDVPDGDLLGDLVLAVYETLTNVADHAYPHAPGQTGPMRLDAVRAQDQLGVRTTDEGRWRPPTEARFRGRGLALVHQLVSHVDIDCTTAGTVVHLRSSLPPPPLRLV